MYRLSDGREHHHHAGVGYGACLLWPQLLLQNNYLFRSWTDASSIVDYLLFARKYITECEERYGVDEVERLLDSCHALMNYGVDRYKRPSKISLQEEKDTAEKPRRVSAKPGEHPVAYAAKTR